MPHPSSSVVPLSLARQHEASNLRAASAREGLARQTRGDDINSPDAPLAETMKKPLVVCQVSDVPESTEVRGVALDGKRVRVRSDEHFEPGELKSEAQSAGAAEEVDRCRFGDMRQPPLDVGGLVRIRCRFV